jgi:hypothetical protein
MGFGVLALVAGCNAAFDLAPTVSIDAGGDFDHDGIFDVADNCATVANSDQGNGDGDAFGDACDTCPTTPSATNHDEDGDFIGDACDVCPGVADFQDDADKDGVGDACDPDVLAAFPMPRMHRRVLFDGFETISADWTASGVAWSSEDDTAVPVSVLPANDRGLVSSALVVNGTWLVVVGYSSKRSWTAEDQIGVGVVVGNKSLRFIADQRSETGEAALYVDGGLVNLLPQYIPRPRGRVLMGAAGNQVDCSFDNNGSIGYGIAMQPGSMLSVAGSPNVRITYIEVLE